jgi:hypothetical protein
MIEFGMGCADLARLRFGYSPLAEVVVGVRLLHTRSPGQTDMYHDWRRAVRGRLGEVRMDLLGALLAAGRFVPSFLSPPPRRLGEALADELAAVAATDEAVLRSELELAHAGRAIPPVLQPLYADPVRHLPAVAGEMNKFWHAAIEPVWARVRAIAMADVDYRLEQFSTGGVAHLLANLHPDLRFEQTRLTIRNSSGTTTALGGHGLVLTPCVLGWPTVLVARRNSGSDGGSDGGPQALFGSVALAGRVIRQG